MDLAIKILDGASLRPADKLLMSVSRAKFEQKGEHCCTFVVYYSFTGYVKHPILGFGLDNILLMALIGFYFFFFFFTQGRDL